jgi:hypothetical protein
VAAPSLDFLWNGPVTSPEDRKTLVKFSKATALLQNQNFLMFLRFYFECCSDRLLGLHVVYILEFTRNEKLWYLPESNSIILKI